MMVKAFLIFIGAMVVAPGARAADDCLGYQLTPAVEISAPQWSKQVIQPIIPMDLWHGNVVATMADNFNIAVDVTPIEDGYCVALKSVDAAIGYEEFNVHIDSRHAPGTCAYNAILAHEDEHIRAYLSVTDDMHDDIHAAVATAAAAVTPVFIQNEGQIDAAMDALHDALQSHPDLILIHNRLRAAQEIRNKSVDAQDDGSRFRRCFE